MKRKCINIGIVFGFIFVLMSAGMVCAAEDVDAHNANTLLEEQEIEKFEGLDRKILLREYDSMVLKTLGEVEQSTNNAPPAFASPQGYVMFPYGAIVPRIVCRPYRVSDIALEPGEEILGIHAGDTVRWLFSPSVSMQGNIKVSHIIIKPAMPNISTNLMIHTDRRAYQLNLISTEKEAYMPGIAFTYPQQDLNTSFGAYSNRAVIGETRKAKDRRNKDQIAPYDAMSGINMGYKIKTKSQIDWKPLSVFDNGLKTYIRMPSKISESPALYIQVDSKETLVNYRVKGRYYIVDRLFDKAFLKVGTRRVVITRNLPIAKQNVYEAEIETLEMEK